MATYTMRLCHPDSDGIDLYMDATTEAEAITECNRAVEQGYRGNLRLGGGTTGYVTLAEGRGYLARNVHGLAVGRIETY